MDPRKPLREVHNADWIKWLGTENCRLNLSGCGLVGGRNLGVCLSEADSKQRRAYYAMDMVGCAPWLDWSVVDPD